MENKIDEIDELITKFLENPYCNCVSGICTGTFPVKMCRRFMIRKIIDICLIQYTVDELEYLHCGGTLPNHYLPCDLAPVNKNEPKGEEEE